MSTKVKILLVLNILVCVAMVMSYLAPHIDPQQYWIFSFFGLIYPFLVIVQLVFLITWLFTDLKMCLLPMTMIASGY